MVVWERVARKCDGSNEKIDDIYQGLNHYEIRTKRDICETEGKEGTHILVSQTRFLHKEADSNPATARC